MVSLLQNVMYEPTKVRAVLDFPPRKNSCIAFKSDRKIVSFPGVGYVALTLSQLCDADIYIRILGELYTLDSRIGWLN